MDDMKKLFVTLIYVLLCCIPVMVFGQSKDSEEPRIINDRFGCQVRGQNVICGKCNNAMSFKEMRQQNNKYIYTFECKNNTHDYVNAVVISCKPLATNVSSQEAPQPNNNKEPKEGKDKDFYFYWEKGDMTDKRDSQDPEHKYFARLCVINKSGKPIQFFTGMVVGTLFGQGKIDPPTVQPGKTVVWNGMVEEKYDPIEKKWKITARPSYQRVSFLNNNPTERRMGQPSQSPNDIYNKVNNRVETQMRNRINSNSQRPHYK